MAFNTSLKKREGEKKTLSVVFFSSSACPAKKLILKKATAAHPRSERFFGPSRFFFTLVRWPIFVCPADAVDTRERKRERKKKKRSRSCNKRQTRNIIGASALAAAVRSCLICRVSNACNALRDGDFFPRLIG